MTGFDEEGIFSLRPLFYSDKSSIMKFNLSSSNFSVRYETYYNHMCRAGATKYEEAEKINKKLGIKTKRKVL